MAENYYGITDTGKLRDNNEDAFIAEPIFANRFIAACVIDGVGGYAGGEVAAAIARQTILDYFSVLSGDITTMMKEALMVANEKIYAEKLHKEDLQKMACVVTLALVDASNHKFYYAHVGDTRLYLLRDYSLVKVTKDHSFVGYLEDSGRLTESAAMQHPKRNEINKALGFDVPISLASDYIETGESPFLPGDMLLLCSDGLTDMIGSSVIASVLNNGKTLPEKGRALIDAANRAGGKDNITVVLVQNNAKPKRQVATKPAAIKKKQEPKNNIVPIQSNPNTVENIPVKKKSNSKAIIILSILCLVLLAAFLWQWFQKPSPVKDNITVPLPMSRDEQRLADTLLNFKGDTLLLQDGLFAAPVWLSDTLWIQQDTLYIKGSGYMGFLRDSAYTGPALALAPSCQYIVLDSLVLQNFDVGILVQNKALHLKNVRFINCSVPVQYQLMLPNDQYLNGSIADLNNLKADSLPQTIKQ